MTRNELREWLFGHLLCGCGEPELALEAFLGVLRYLATPHLERDTSYATTSGNTGLLFLAFYQAEHLGLAEHGGTVVAGWLTPAGKEVLAVLEEHHATVLT